MTTTGIMQPTYLPWIGYFKMIQSCDNFIFLDSVQFDKRSWQQRNYIRGNSDKILLSIPVLSKGQFHQKINQVKINNDLNWKKKHLNSIFHSYSKSKFFNEFFPELSKIYNKEYIFLKDLNIKLIKFISNKLNFKTKFSFSSKYNFETKKDELLFQICNKLNSKIYLSSPGSKIYLSTSKFFNQDYKNNIKLQYFNYREYEYKQINKLFMPNLSIIDFLFNRGVNEFNLL